MSSTLGAMPRVDEPLDYDSLTRYVTSKCGPISTIEIEGFDEVETYIDSGRRLIHIKFPPLPPAEEKELRHEQLMMADKALRNTLRKLPSPSQTVIYSSSIGPQYFNKLNEKRYAKMGIFPDISKDESRKSEFERNDRVKKEEHKLPEKRNNLLKNDELKYQISKFIDSDLILENEWLVIGVAFTAVIFIVKIFLDLLSFIWGLVFGKSEKEKVEKENKKTK
ncbi:hypothetical protein WICPIJ_001464 [Wickerhamomyces pijperi]|uniref:Protein BIG1 n=1 Tax=Wickerhamomyces pijperi TaxID=599730 RepID=A0A9P8QAW6_WICPI|nr:hypothetical protein WICPIJ_001464 [Wickerhamomyces pijperi]